jgi:hypothetical protein
VDELRQECNACAQENYPIPPSSATARLALECVTLDSGFPPGKVFRIINHGPLKVYNPDHPSLSAKFQIHVSYVHGASGKRVLDEFHFHFAGYQDMLLYGPDIDRLEQCGEELCRCVRELTQEVRSFSRQRF